MPTHLLPRTTHAKQITATIIRTNAPPPEAAAINVNERFPGFPDKKKKKKKNSKHAHSPSIQNKLNKQQFQLVYRSIHSAFFTT